ncbi:hypothetical protein D9623_30645 [Azospirillum brasilense]|uniref:Uncharacterized protein n=1 Tax=Azospirillum brasilense TaxID=192 RepID=A0A0P0FDN5_AZOBR|nr:MULTISPECIES: hypothetical protein [Azospirillum]ALJ39078.1 hypothetical protein AMK58_26755 [Azospirillum brasilense]MDW7557705.1 hypothetical protein [Azospirillum brasilense]MDW7595767.1 hypothetical protein [Azospirillum brasilense]MDW7630772.1 hypothetical protein [Azospirillum brasilense]MDX5950503.1 hypothetical protein [Azospirillum brasilense]
MPTSPHGSPDRRLKPFILAIHREALKTAAAKGLTGSLAQVAALQDTASLVSVKAGRLVTEEEVMRLLLRERRARKIHEAVGTAPVAPLRKPAAPSRFRLGRWRALAMGVTQSTSAGLAGKVRL